MHLLAFLSLKIDFRLEGYKFPDNKIYGTIRVIPESSRRLIEKFFVRNFIKCSIEDYNQLFEQVICSD